MSRRIAEKAFEAIPERHERPSPAGGGGGVGGASAAAMLPKQQRRAEPPKAFPPHANVADPASRVPPYGVFPSNTSAYGSCSGAALGEAELQGQAVARVGGAQRGF